MGRARKRFGQHFLRHPGILAKIVDALEAPPGAGVLEIGPGKGALTAVLVERGYQVTAIEKDRDLLPRLRDRFPTVRLAEGDALTESWEALAGVPRADLYVIGNIPYNITSPLLDRALAPPRPRRVVFLVQKEVADRLVATPASGNWSALTVGVQAVARVTRTVTVPAAAFDPPPKVDSAVVRFDPLPDPLVQDAELPRFRRLVTALFASRRKQIQRGLRLVTGWPADRVLTLLAAVEIPPTLRPDALPVAGFVALLRALVDETNGEH